MGIANITNNILTDSGVLTSSLVSGTGTTNYLPKWTSGSALGNSLIYDDGNVISIGTNATLVQTLNINSTYASQSLNSTSGNFAYIALLNGATGGGFVIGAEGSTGGTFGTGSTAYAGVLSRLGAYNLQFATNNVVGMTLFSTGNLALNSTTDNGNRLQVTGNGYFSGNVGIGVTSLSYPLVVATGASNPNTISLINNINNISQYSFIQNGSTTLAYTAIVGDGRATGYLAIKTNDTERMRLDSFGNLGLGVVPSAWGSVKAIDLNTGGASGAISASGTFTTAMNAYYDGTNWIYKNNNYATIFQQSAGNGSHAWYNAPSGTAGAAISFVQRMTLTAAGRLLLGTTSDNGARLQVTGETRLDGELFVTGSTGYIQVGTGSLSKISIESTGTTGIIGTRDASDFALRTNLITRLTIASTGAATFSSSVTATNFYSTGASNFATSSGNVGIGTSNPTEGKLVVSNSGPSVIYLKETSVGVNSFWNSSDGSEVQFGVASNHPLKLRTNNTDRLTITSGGNLLVGTTVDSGYRLDVNGTGRFSGSSNTILTLDSSNATGYTAVQINASGTAKGLIGYGTYLTTDGGMAIRTAASTPFTIAIGSGVPNFTLASSGAATFSSSVTATSFVKTSGTSAQFLKADGSVDSSTYILLTSLSATSPLSYNNLTGAFTISQASSSFNGYLSSTDWITFNSKIGGSGSTGYIPKFTSASAIGNSLIFDNGTNVGIGTASPTRSLDVNNELSVRNSNDQLLVSPTGAGLIRIYARDFSTFGDISLGFFTGVTERMRITSGGNLLVGTTTDSGERLQVSGNGYISGNLGLGISASSWASFTGLNIGFRGSISSNTVETHISHNAYYDGAWKFISTGIASDYYSANGSHIWRKSLSGGIPNSTITFTQTMTLTASGRLLLGTTVDTGYRVQITSASADSHLNVWGATSPSIRIDNAATGATQRFVFGLATDTNNFITGAVAGDICMTTQSSSPLLFGANALEVMRITTSRNLLINTQVDLGYRLQVAGTSFMNGSTSIGVSSGTSWLTIQSGDTSRAQITLYQSTAPTSPSNGDIWFDGSDVKIRIAGVTKTFTIV